MIQSIFSRSLLPLFKTANYTVNRVPSNSFQVIPFEGWTGRKPGFNHIHILGCQAEAHFYNPHEKKLDPRTIQVVDSLDILRNQRVLSSTALIPIPNYKRPTMLNSLRLEEELVQHSSSEFEEESSNKVQHPSIEFEEIRCGENDLIAA